MNTHFNTPPDFAQFLSGFDFLKTWAAPALSMEELDKRIGELKTVQFWLDQNAQGLKAMVQALEVQKMTLATLQGMNVKVDDIAQAAGHADPLQWWKALTEQFQNVAATATANPTSTPTKKRSTPKKKT